jgi:hypothetical protein
VSKWVRSVVIGLCTAVLGFALILIEVATNFEFGFERDMGLPWLFEIRGPLPSPRCSTSW